MALLHIIWNPVAGNGRAARAFAAVEADLKARGVPYSAARSAYPGHAVELAKKALQDGCAPIVALGGDGTAREVASGLFSSDAPMGIIPCGTGNDLARALRIPDAPAEALELILSGRARPMDAAMANDELYFNIAGFGFDVDVLDYTEIYKKKTQNGSWAYLRALFRALAGLKTRMTRIETPEGTIERDVLLMVAANGTHFGGGMHIAPEADPFDGLLDVCVIHDVNRLSVLGLLTNLKSGNHIKSKKHVSYFRASELRAVCEPSSRLDVDGEVLPGTPVTFRILPKSLNVIAGA
ncbi:MAG: diacylglycerol kinase family lipid kinase [Clostridia bacterium]|nr:diacylglycerol kinase family lipid kinase [Clostridia bacterium]